MIVWAIPLDSFAIIKMLASHQMVGPKSTYLTGLIRLDTVNCFNTIGIYTFTIYTFDFEFSSEILIINPWFASNNVHIEYLLIWTRHCKVQGEIFSVSFVHLSLKTSPC